MTVVISTRIGLRGLLVGLTHRLLELTNRLTELSGGRVEARLARFFLKLANDIGQTRPGGVYSPRAVTAGACRHDRHDDRDIDSCHEPVEQTGSHPHRERWFPRRRFGGVANCRAELRPGSV